MARSKGKKTRAKNGANGKRRQNGTGTIERRGDKWLARWTVRNPQGAIVRRSEVMRPDENLDRDIPHPVGSVDWARARLRLLTEGNALQTREGELRRTVERLEGVKAEIQKWEESRPSLAVADAWELFDADPTSKTRDPATQANYGQWFGLFEKWLKDNHGEVKELRRVDSVIAREYSVHLLGRVRGTTFNRHMNALALIWATLAARDADGKPIYPDARLGGNPFAWDKRTRSGIQRVTLKRGERPHRRRDLTLEELARLMDAASGEMRVLIALGFYSGLRLGDCALLDWGRIDRVNGVIVTRSRKTDTETETRIHPKLAAIIEAETTERTGYLMPSVADLYNHGTTGRVKLTRMIQAVFAAAGIETSYKESEGDRARPDCGFHSLRHTYVTQLERVGATLAERQRLAGHRTARMTAHYTHGDAGRVLALPDITAGNVQTVEADQWGGTDKRADRLAAFRAAWDALDEDERNEARAIIEGRA